MMQKLEFRAMGCQMLAALDSDSPRAAERLGRVPGWFEAWEQCLSRFREDSELKRLNRRPGELVRVSKVLWDVIKVALQAAGESDGLVTPTLLEALKTAGYDRRFDVIAPAEASPWQSSPPVVGEWRAIELHARTRTVRLPPGMRLDLCGVAKGWAAHQAMRRLQAYGPALVDAGGDVAIGSLQTNRQPWPIGVTDPHDPGSQLELLLLGRGGVATSGRDYRRWQWNGVWQHHIIDPRTGRPAETDVLSATVIAPSVRQAEVAAKMTLISGSQAGLIWLEAHPSLASLLVLEDGRVLHSQRLERYLWS